ncbi:MAG: biopolymer transporter ExbD [Myxococcales bacterium]|nr:biopolymer transporter ExbD [Myxococcales bacterium]
MSEGEASNETLAEINVTPMIDVLMSLLIIFLVAAKPPPKHKQPIAVPQDPVTQTENDPDATLLVKIDAQGQVSVGKTPVAGGHEALVEALKASEKAQTDGKVAVKADGKVPYGSVIDVMFAAHAAGIEHVGIASDRL